MLTRMRFIYVFFDIFFKYHLIVGIINVFKIFNVSFLIFCNSFSCKIEYYTGLFFFFLILKFWIFQRKE